MPETSLVVVDPGHFHATLVQQQMYPELSPVVRVYAPLGPDLIDYLSRIARYNRRPQAATDWRLDVHAGPDFLDWISTPPHVPIHPSDLPSRSYCTVARCRRSGMTHSEPRLSMRA